MFAHNTMKNMTRKLVSKGKLLRQASFLYVSVCMKSNTSWPLQNNKFLLLKFFTLMFDHHNFPLSAQEWA